LVFTEVSKSRTDFPLGALYGPGTGPKSTLYQQYPPTPNIHRHKQDNKTDESAACHTAEQTGPSSSQNGYSSLVTAKYSIVHMEDIRANLIFLEKQTGQLRTISEEYISYSTNMYLGLFHWILMFVKFNMLQSTTNNL